MFKQPGRCCGESISFLQKSQKCFVETWFPVHTPLFTSTHLSTRQPQLPPLPHRGLLQSIPTQLCNPILCSSSLTPPEPNAPNAGDSGDTTPEGAVVRACTLTVGWLAGRCQEPWSRECTVKPLCQMACPLPVVRAALYFLALLMRREHFELSKPYNLVSLAHEQQQHTVEHNNKGERAVELNKNLNLRVRSLEKEALAVLFPGTG